MEFEAALAQEAIGVFGRTGLTPSQLADGLTECKIVRQRWVDAYVRMRETLRRVDHTLTAHGQLHAGTPLHLRIQEDLSNEEYCQTCDGTGDSDIAALEGECPACGGSGRVK